MEGQVQIINGRPLRVIERKGKFYVRKVIEFEVNEYGKGEAKVQEFSKNFTDLLRELLSGWNKSMGLIKQDHLVKDAGSLFDNRMSRHIQTAIYRAVEEIVQYFGFTLRDIAQRMGLSKDKFSKVMQGTRKLKDYEAAKLKDIFIAMEIEAKTKDFKETPGQLLSKGLWQRLKISLTLLAICGSMVSVMGNIIFLKTLISNSLQYIVEECADLAYSLHTSSKAVVVLFTAIACVFLHKNTEKINKFYANPNSQSWGFLFI